MMTPQVPIDCPRCGKTLYPISAMRPRSRASMLAWLGFAMAGLVASGLYLGGFYLVRVRAGVYIPTAILALILVVPAVAVALVLTLPFARLPRVVKLRCARCKWGERYREVRSTARRRFGPTAAAAVAGLGSARAAPEMETELAAPAGAPEAADFDAIVDDRGKLDEAKAWIYAEFIGGRSFEEISEQLRARGWSDDDIEGMVEEGRKATRHRRP